MKIIDNGKGNIIVTGDKLASSSIVIKIKGNNNLIKLGDIPRIGKINITLEGEENTIIIGNLRRVGNLNILLKGNANLHIKDNTTIEDAYMLIDKSSAINIGYDCMISFKVSLRTTDAHGIYDLKTGILLNPSENIILENHVWIAQDVIVSKGVHINKNSIIGAKSFVQKVNIPNNSIAAGIPAKVIKSNVIWDRRMTKNLYDEDANFDFLLKRWL